MGAILACGVALARELDSRVACGAVRRSVGVLRSLTRNVRSDERTKNIPIIMITSRSADKHRNVALELGVNAYFGKPFQEDVLLEAISDLLN